VLRYGEGIPAGVAESNAEVAAILKGSTARLVGDCVPSRCGLRLERLVVDVVAPRGWRTDEETKSNEEA
jgi:hypothetical protein